jgi:hypothetical protein
MPAVVDDAAGSDEVDVRPKLTVTLG